MCKCGLLDLEVFMYILSLAFQVAGAILLIIYYWGNTEKRILIEYFPASGVILQDEKGNVKLEKKRIQESAQKIYDNRMSFVYIAIGYVFSIFGDAEGNCKMCLLTAVIACIVLLILLEKVLIHLLAKIFYRDGIVKNIDELGEVMRDRLIATGEANNKKIVERTMIVTICENKNSEREKNN